MIIGLKHHDGYKYVEDISYLQIKIFNGSNISNHGLLKQLFNVQRYYTNENLHMVFSSSNMNSIGGCLYDNRNNLMAIVTVKENATPYSYENSYFADDLTLFISDKFIRIGLITIPAEYFAKSFPYIEIKIMPEEYLNSFILDVPLELKRKDSKLLKDAMAEIVGKKVQQTEMKFDNIGLSNGIQWNARSNQRVYGTAGNPLEAQFVASIDPIGAQEEPVEGDYTDEPIEF